MKTLARLQRRLAYERFLARLFSVVGDTWVLKGGYALELRLGGRARATKDLDFHASGDTELLDTLQEAAEADLDDHFRFVVQPPERGTLGGPEVHGVMRTRRGAAWSSISAGLGPRSHSGWVLGPPEVYDRPGVRALSSGKTFPLNPSSSPG
ncbi:nucleotidyl transferase AbiEii/AbiGii toxin family protein [Deinococcus planocerae]|uniref:nucleotidyl transferase AbiEii/AbiGii toxin family protein n=1 Tax=Deinococcus planocerae TaxID=1737569 RepID=UPI000C7ED13D|nr:nucleotidyl transferase AbiEii/AbiGii toxin family protein [Deinococcus planocerae]